MEEGEKLYFMPIPQILEKLTEILALSLNQLARNIGDKPDKFYRMMHYGVRPSYETLQSILEKYPEVSGDFLLGKGGDVLGKQAKEPENIAQPVAVFSEATQPLVMTIQILEKEIKERDKRIAELEKK
jgi:hypothetical protein